MSLSWYLTVVLIFFSLTISNEHLCMCLLTTDIPTFFKEMSIQVLAVFKSGCLPFCCWVVRVFYVFCIFKSYHIQMICKYFSHSLGCLFTLLIVSFWVKVLIWCSPIYLFTFVACAFGVISKKSLLNPMSQSFPLCLFLSFSSYV